MNPRDITDVSQLQELVVMLLNRQEELLAELAATRQELSEALDEIKRLKGEKGAPKFKKRKKSNIFSPNRSQSPSRSSRNKSDASSHPPDVDRVEMVDSPPSDLPTDAQFKGWRSVYQKDIRLVREVIEYRIARWYSPSKRRHYESALPKTYRGQIGSMLQSFIQILHHCGDMTHRKIKDLLEHLGIGSSSGGISNILTHSEWVCQEQAALLQKSLTHSPYTQMDSTGSRQEGKGMYTQIICGAHFSLFYTQQGRSRLDVYAALQGQNRDQVRLAYTELAHDRMLAAKVSQKHMSYIAQHFALGQDFSMAQLEEHFDSAPIFTRTNQSRRTAIASALAAGYYHQQDQVPVVEHLMTDDASEYKGVALKKHIHCWIHAIRHYRILNPKNQYLRDIHADFMDKLWALYNRLKAYQELPPEKQLMQKSEIALTFDQLFNSPTDYERLNQQLAITREKRAYLLAVLDHPNLPLHNNDAERAARRVVRKRDISLHTWSQRGTRIRDAFMSLHQTAKKLNMSFLDYLYDRNSGQYQLKSIAQQLQEAYEAKTATF